MDTAAEEEVWEAFSALFSSAQLSQDWGCPENPPRPQVSSQEDLTFQNLRSPALLTCKEEDTNQKMCSLDYCLEDMITTLVEMTITILQNSNPSIAAAFHSNSCVIP